MSKRPFVIFGLLAAICVLAIPIIALGKEGGDDAGTVQVAEEDRDAQALFAPTAAAATHSPQAAPTASSARTSMSC